jgi:hypothetical protein
MKDSFNRFALRLLLTLLLGLALLALRTLCACGATGVLAPRFASPWELSKLAYWPLLGALTATARLSGGWRRTLRSAARYLTAVPLALFAADWAISLLRPSGGIYLLAWVVAATAGAALCDQERPAPGRSAWPVLAAALGALYLLFTFLPPMFGPFLDPADVAAMAAIPW